MSEKQDALKFAYWVPNVSGGLVVSTIEQRTDWSVEYNQKLAQTAEKAGFDYALITPSATQSASLIGSGLTVSGSQTDWGGSFSLSQQISNNGTADAPRQAQIIFATSE